MEEEPLQTGRRILKKGGTPRGGWLLLFIGSLLVAWTEYWFPEIASLAPWTTWTMLVIAASSAAVVILMIIYTLPPYIHFAKKGEEATAATAIVNERYI